MTYLLFFLGASIGSFLGVVIDRFPEQSIITPSSHCHNCQTHLKPWDLIPILSQVIYRFKCRYCQVSIPFWYAGFEGLCGGIFLIWHWGMIDLWQLYFLLLSLTLSIYDLKTQSYPLIIWLGASLPLFLAFGINTASLLLLLLALLAECYYIKMGSGDFLYLASLSLLIPHYQLLWVIQVSCLVAIIYLLKKGQQAPIAFVPFLTLGYMTILISDYVLLSF